MSTLVSIENVGVSIEHRIDALPVLVIFLHNQCNCRCVMCDIWRIREAQQISPADLDIGALRNLGVRWVVFSGGEPQLNEQWSTIAQMLRSIGCRVTLLTAGLLLKEQARKITDNIDDVIVSLDGPPEIHNKIRRITNAFEQVAEGIQALRGHRPDMAVRARCTVQKANFRSLRATVTAAKEIGLNSISFLAADVSSSAFNHPQGWSSDRSDRVSLDQDEINELGQEMEKLAIEYSRDLKSGFVVESAGKLRRIVEHFRAQAAGTPAIAPRCNAPWVSAVIEASGDVRPCFFHPVMGNVRQQGLQGALNSPAALRFRQTLDVESNPVCQRCVCSLHLPREGEGNAATV